MSAARQGRQARVRGGRHVIRKVRVTPDQDGRLAQLAAAQGVSVPRLLVESALAGDGWTPTQRRALVRELLAARRDLAGLATNVNQLARWANTVERFPREAAGRLDAIDRVTVLIDDAIRGLEACS